MSMSTSIRNRLPGTIEKIVSDKVVSEQRYVIDFELTREGRIARVRSAWIIRKGEDFPRLVTCYVI
jgi:hypothetical protein